MEKMQVSTAEMLNEELQSFPGPRLGKVVLSPVSFIQDNDLVSSFGQCDLLLSKHFDLIPHHVDSSAGTTSDSHNHFMSVQCTFKQRIVYSSGNFIYFFFSVH